MLTFEQALNAREFHFEAKDLCVRRTGPRGAVCIVREVWRRNGRTKTWKTRPTNFDIHVKHGFYDSRYITEREADLWHTAEECPANEGR